jgi:hypothetical protein
VGKGEKMKTLKEIEFEPDCGDDIYKRFDGDIESIMKLSQEKAIREEIIYQLGTDWYDILKGKIEKFGGRIVWDKEEER